MIGAQRERHVSEGKRGKIFDRCSASAEKHEIGVPNHVTDGKRGKACNQCLARETLSSMASARKLVHNRCSVRENRQLVITGGRIRLTQTLLSLKINEKVLISIRNCTFLTKSMKIDIITRNVKKVKNFLSVI